MPSFTFDEVAVYDVLPGGGVRTLRGGTARFRHPDNDALIATVPVGANGRISYSSDTYGALLMETDNGFRRMVFAPEALAAAAQNGAAFDGGTFGVGAAPNPAFYQARVLAPAATGRVALRVDQQNTGAVDAVKVVNASTGYALKIDHTADDQDAVNFNATGTGSYTTLGVGGSNTSLSTVKVTNAGAQVGGAVVFAQGIDTGRTAPVFTAENYGTGASFAAHAMNGAQSPSFRAIYDAGFNHTARALWVDANHTSGSILYVNNATAQTGGSMVQLTQAAGSTAPIIQITNNGSGDHINANNFRVSQAGSVSCVALLNTSTFNNSRVQLTSLGTVVDRNVADSAAALRVNQSHASSTGDIVQFQAGGAVQSRVMRSGSFATRNTAAPPDADLAAGEAAMWFDSTNGAAKIMWKAKQADGTVRTGSVALA